MVFYQFANLVNAWMNCKFFLHGSVINWSEKWEPHSK